MAFLRAQRLLYLHPADERVMDEAVLVASERKTCYQVTSPDDFESLKRWAQNELAADRLLVPGQGWTVLASMQTKAPLPDRFTLHARESILGKRTAVSSLATPTGPSTKRQKAIAEYKPQYVETGTIIGPCSSNLLADLRWLHLLAEEGSKVRLDELRKLRIDGIKPKESVYYPGVLAMLKSASVGQEGLIFTGQGYGLQGFINRVLKTPSDVKVDLKKATDEDPYGLEANAVDIKQVADHLVEGIESSGDTARLGCLFSRMDRFFLIKYVRGERRVKVTPAFPRAQEPNTSPQLFSEEFTIMRLAWLDRWPRETLTLSDVLPAESTHGFRTLVAYVEEIQRMFSLSPSAVRFVRQDGREIQPNELSCVACGHKSLVLLRRSSQTIVKVCVPEHAENEIRIHNTVDGHEHVRALVSHGRVHIGNAEGLFSFLELEGLGEPLKSAHVSTAEAMEEMWKQAMSALKHLHSRGVLHRDVKPDNMLVFHGGVLKLNDFDVSCFVGDGRDSSEIVGTVGFQSPSNMSPYVEADDILALGLAFYKAFAGVAPPGRDTRLHILRDELHPRRFPEPMRQAVRSALAELGLESRSDQEYCEGAMALNSQTPELPPSPV